MGKSTFLQRPVRCHASRCEAQSSSLLLQCCSAAVMQSVLQSPKPAIHRKPRLTGRVASARCMLHAAVKPHKTAEQN